ncbi:MAG: prephenate dehydrogenase/arogenate dehydrogenase family protein [Haliscomenobacter sp.]|nr:prephenate dehydrogenase/arogenate dehydrogenase family protein [Haliscomenobacter sp.]MBK9491634.1 prephenate dehydrogenase/arogenate dehydrogenase family protein [Haliscomenobacter sp.]
MTISIIGIGLIGGSLAITLKENGFAQRIIGVDVNPDNIDKAIRRRLIDEGKTLDEAIAESDLIIVATPVDSMTRVLPLVLDKINEKQVVIDVGSTKTLILEAVQDHPMRRRFVATHPMAGTEYSGPEAAVPKLFGDNVLDVLDEHISQLSQFRSLLIKKDFDTFHKLISEANQIRKIIS